MAASPEALHEALFQYPDAAQAICAARGLVMSALHEQLVGARVDPRDRGLHQYLRGELLNPCEERVHAVFLNREGFYLHGETVAHGMSGRVMMRIRGLLHRALDLGAAALLLAHNHPSGSSNPSTEDIEATRRFESIAAALELELIDHLIVTAAQVYSLKLRRTL